MPHQRQSSAVARTNGFTGKQLMKIAVTCAWRAIAPFLGDYFGIGEFAGGLLVLAWPFIKRVIKKGIRKLLRAALPGLSEHVVPALADAAFAEITD